MSREELPLTDSLAQAQASIPAATPLPREDKGSDLGFGTQPQGRLLDPDGNFNVRRRGIARIRSSNSYHLLITMPWPWLGLLIIGVFIGINLLFTALYVLVGVDQFTGLMPGERALGVFWELFFFSTQTFTTVGYGRVNPLGFGANAIAALESMSGLLSFALATGVLYGRFALPQARIRHSREAIIAPYADGWALMFRIVNERENQIIDVSVQVNYSYQIDRGPGYPSGRFRRGFHALALERSQVYFFPTTWTLVHPIGPTSPLYGLTTTDLAKLDVEFLILVKGFDDTFAQTVHSRFSYKAEEIAWHRRFEPATEIDPSGNTLLFLDRLHAHTAVNPPGGPAGN
jgi:inward rectifier potassium channel